MPEIPRKAKVGEKLSDQISQNHRKYKSIDSRLDTLRVFLVINTFLLAILCGTVVGLLL